jgi:hypothetical protein
MRAVATAAIVLAVALAVPAAGCAGPRGARPGAGRGAATAEGAASMPGPAGGPGTHARTPSAVAQLCGPPDAPGQLITVRAADGVRLAAVAAGGR